MNEFKFKVSADDIGLRIDKYLSENQTLNITRNAVQGLIGNEDILVNGKAVTKNYKLRNEDIITVSIPEPIELDVTAENIPIEIVYEDNDLLVVNKPKGMVVHPAVGNYNGTLVNALLYHCNGRLSAINGIIRPGIVHRIDKDTSGLLIVAKNDTAHLGLSKQIKEHSFTREYEAIVCGHFKAEAGTINAPIGRHPVDRKKMCVTEKNSRNAVTHYSVLAEYGKYTHVRLKLETGRTHQIRVHLAYLGHSVLGDSVYGKPFKGIEGQCLHAKKIGFLHPITDEYLEFKSDLPDYFKAILENLKKQQ